MRQEISGLQKVKTGVHTAQALLIFITACITIAVFTGTGKTGGGSKWLFAVCWLSIPALIYLVAVPLWTRAENVAKAMWFATVDTMFAIFWLSAIIAIAVWKRNGVNQGATDHKIDLANGNCTTFAYGTEKQCTLTHTSSIIGLFIFLFFAVTSGISIFYTYKAKKDPQADDPWLKKTVSSQSYAPTFGGAHDLESTGKDGVWDHNTQELDEVSDHSDDGHGHTPGLPGQNTREEEEEYDLHNTEEGIHPGRPVHWGPLGGAAGGRGGAPPLAMPGVDTEYRGGAGAPSAMSPDPYSPAPEYNPSDRYGARTGAGYTFSRPEVGR